MADPTVIRIDPPLTLDEIKDGPELSAIELICLRPDGEDIPAQLWPVNVVDYAGSAFMNYAPNFIRDQIQKVVDHYADREFTGFIEVRNSSPGQPPVSRFVMRDRRVVQLDPFVGWPPEQADDSEDGLMDILRDPDAVVSVSGMVAGYATDVWETVPADDTDLPERLLAWRDAAVQRALAEAAAEAAAAPQWAIWSYVQGGWWAEGGHGFVIDANKAARFTAQEARALIDEEAREGLAEGKPRSLMMMGPEVRTADDDVTVMNSRLKWAFQNELAKYGPDGYRADLAEAGA